MAIFVPDSKQTHYEKPTYPLYSTPTVCIAATSISVRTDRFAAKTE